MGLSLNGCNCYYNTGVTCSGEIRPCDKCGWNPDVDAKRKAKLFRKETKQIRYEVKQPEEVRRTWIVKWVD